MTEARIRSTQICPVLKHFEFSYLSIGEGYNSHFERTVARAMAFTTRLLPDKPTTQDEFGTHNRVATAIYLGVANESETKDLALLMLLLYSIGDPSGTPGSAANGTSIYRDWLANPSASTVREVAELAIEFDQVSQLRAKEHGSESSRKALDAVLKVITERGATMND